MHPSLPWPLRTVLVTSLIPWTVRWAKIERIEKLGIFFVWLEIVSGFGVEYMGWEMELWV